MKEDYEAIALAKAEAKGPKEVLALLHLDFLDHVLAEKRYCFLSGRPVPEEAGQRHKTSEDWKIIGSSCVIVLQSGLVFHPKTWKGQKPK